MDLHDGEVPLQGDEGVSQSGKANRHYRNAPWSSFEANFHYGEVVWHRCEGNCHGLDVVWRFDQAT